MTNFKYYLGKVNYFFAYLGGIFMLIMGIIIMYEVIVRYLFNSPTKWVQETSIYFFIWAMYIGAAYTLQKKQHVHVDLIVAKLPKISQNILKLITNIIAFIFCVIVLIQAYGMLSNTIKYGKYSPTPLHIHMAIPELSIFVGFSLLTLQFLVNILEQYNFTLDIKKNKNDNK